jgi:hypothetical protein
LINTSIRTWSVRIPSAKVRTESVAARRGRDPDTDPYPRIAAGMALLVFDAVLQQWQPGDDEQRLAELTDQAFAVVAPALDAPAG